MGEDNVDSVEIGQCNVPEEDVYDHNRWVTFQSVKLGLPCCPRGYSMVPHPFPGRNDRYRIAGMHSKHTVIGIQVGCLLVWIIVSRSDSYTILPKSA